MSDLILDGPNLTLPNGHTHNLYNDDVAVGWETSDGQKVWLDEDGRKDIGKATVWRFQEYGDDTIYRVPVGGLGPYEETLVSYVSNYE